MGCAGIVLFFVILRIMLPFVVVAFIVWGSVKAFHYYESRNANVPTEQVQPIEKGN
jgi:hypothetical protein